MYEALFVARPRITTLFFQREILSGERAVLNPHLVSAKLAIALGHELYNVALSKEQGHPLACLVYGGHEYIREGYGAWRMFDYRDPTVIWPVAKAFDAFPRATTHSRDWWTSVYEVHGTHLQKRADASSPELAVAKAVILMRGGRL